MRWRIAAKPKITRRANQAEAEVMHPDTVDNHSGRQRIPGIDNRLRQFESAASLMKQLVVTSADARQEPSRRRRPRVVRIASKKNMPRRWIGYVFHRHR